MLNVINKKYILQSHRAAASFCRMFANTVDTSKNLYVLPMFPYPSGKAHMGHVRVFSISDCITRYKRMCGYNVIHPMGWDAFGLPAENAAMERGIPPAEWTEKNIKDMRQQIDVLNCSFNWEKEINTSKSDYYKWTQWLFLKLWENGYISRKNGLVNWDPVDKTVLANEQVDEEGRSWRSGAIVEKRKLEQWYVLTTKMSETLLQGLSQLTNWPNDVKTAQKRWIGKSKGAEVIFQISGSTKTIPIFTTHLETIMGVSFIGLSANHPLTLDLASNDSQLQSFLNNVSKCPYKVSEGEVKGYKLPITVIHPITHHSIPVYVSNYVLSDYGDGAVMGVPSHDDRDHAFATLFNLPMIQVISDKQTLQNSGHLNGLSLHEGIQTLLKEGKEAHWCKAVTQYRLRDWLISRQRYWGTPIPAIHCPHCGIVPVPMSDLPVQLPQMNEHETSKMSGDETISPLGRYEQWKHVKCPVCGNEHAERDCDTLDTFMDSSWYYYRYLDPQNKDTFCSSKQLQAFPHVNYYIGGAEHSIMHLLFARFMSHFLYEQHLCPSAEPFDHLITQGKYLHPEDVEQHGTEYKEKKTQDDVIVKYMKMSKSKYNGIDPVDVVKQYGSDVVRIGMLMQCPITNSFLYNAKCMNPANDMMTKLEKICAICKDKKSKATKALDMNKLNSQYNKIIHDMSNFEFHNVLSSINIMLNELVQSSYSSHYLTYVKQVLLFLAPFAPIKSEAMWTSLQEANCIKKTEGFSQQKWPSDKKQMSTLVIIQINGKMKKTVNLDDKCETDDQKMIAFIEKKDDIKRLINFTPADIKIIRKGHKIVINYLKYFVFLKNTY